MSTFFNSANAPKEAGPEGPSIINPGSTANGATPASIAPNIVLSSDPDPFARDETSPRPPSDIESTLVGGSTRGPTPIDQVNQKKTVSEDHASQVPSYEQATEGSDEKRLTQDPVVKDDEKSSSDSDAENKDEGPEPEYPTAWKLGLISIALCLCVFCVALDNTIIATAIPKITDEFNSLNDVGWYGSAYLLTTCAVTLMFGKLYTFYPVKWTYLVALTIFEIGSLVCAVTPSSVGLICGRAIAGLGAAGLFSGSILIITQSVSLVKRPLYTGILGAMFGVASVAGPLMGGAFTDRLSWRWCFYINLPIGGVTFFFILFFFKASKALKPALGWKEQLAEVDLLGSCFFLPAIISLLLALQWGGVKYPWNSGRIIALFVVFGVLIIIFGVIQWRGQDRATVPPRLIKNRNVWGSAWYALAIGAAYFVFVYYLPIWFQAIKGASAVKSGIMNLPTIISVVLLSILAGGLVTACGYYTPFMIASSIILTIGAGMLSTLAVDSGHAKWIGYQALFGIGLGLGMQQPMIVVQTALKPVDVPSGTALVMFSQTLGGAIFISVAQNIFQNQLLHYLQVEASDANAAQLVAGGATMLRQLVSGTLLQQVLHAYNDAITQTFYVAVAMGALSLIGPIFVEWLSVKGKKVEPVAA
ncbi:MFS-type toxin efflux pump [Penicillium ucsense]|uniref:MFS-type toxin efflux pump n=1 Tax=Penicillium ucsense TaxID=2839758 RepID=A0A8J8W7K6_9EURO|nr:MFS-type toxin efflux pump [Penicillium ucsense]KAF7737848.1 MFS-type toxin efflux pump [Penicillium ucsense]